MFSIITSKVAVALIITAVSNGNGEPQKILSSKAFKNYSCSDSLVVENIARGVAAINKMLENNPSITGKILDVKCVDMDQDAI